MALPQKLIRIINQRRQCPPITSILFLLIYCAVTAAIPSDHSLSTVSISKTSDRTTICALLHRPNKFSSLNCTSFPPGLSIPETPTTVPFLAVVAGDEFVCGLRSSTSVLGCWRFSSNGSDLYYKRIYKGPTLLELAAGNTHFCVLVNGIPALKCWQWRGFNATGVQGIATNVAVGDDFVCGLSDKGEIICSGNPQSVQNSPRGSHSSIAAGSKHACAISTSGRLNCWGEAVGEKPQGRFTSVALGENRSCALRSNGTVVCWGQSNFSLPVGMRDSYFFHIEAKRSVFCGVLTSNFSLYCWGDQQLDSNRIIFENVVPGSCRSSCPCGPLALYSKFCSQGYICEPCEGEAPPVESEPPLPLPLLPSPHPPQRRREVLNDKMVAFIIVGSVGSACLLLLCCFLLFNYCKGKVCRIHDSGRLEEAERQEQLEPSPAQPLHLPPRVLEKRLSHLVSMGIGNGGHLEEFSLQSLAEATNSFAQECKIGSGSFGSVYRAELEDGREVAIKRAEFSEASNGGVTKRQLEDKDHAFVNELESLSRLNHKNLVRLLGFCEDNNELILVYEYMVNGTLHDHLHKLSSSPMMSWTARLKIALDAARGIEYLHVYAVPPVIHRDIKSSNILLDSNWTAKVSDFGLSLMGPEDEESHLSLHAAGTVGYVDPEYYRLQHLTLKSDIYSFGVVLLELLSGYHAIHKNENQVPRNVVDLVVPYIIHNQIHRVLDPKVPSPSPFEIEAVKYVGYLAADCVSLEGKDRPSSTEVVDALERALVACSAQPTRSLSLGGDSYIDPAVNLSFLNAVQKCKSF